MFLLFVVFGTCCVLTESRANPKEDELFLVAQKAFDDGFHDVAIRYIEQFQQKYPNSPKTVQAKLLLGQCYFFKNQYLKAFEIFQALSGITEFRDATLFWLGETYFKGGDYSQAEKNYHQVIKTYPNSVYAPQALYSLAWTYFDQHRYKEAKEQFTEMLKKYPAHTLSEEAAFKIGESSYLAGDLDTAIAFFRDFLNVFPKSSRFAEANFFAAEAFFSKEDYLTAVSYYAQASAKTFDPRVSVLAKIGLGWCYLKLQKFDLSLKNFLEAEKLAQEKGVTLEDVWIGIASLYSEAGDIERSTETYKKLISEYPSSARIPESYLGLAHNAYTLGQYEDAVTHYTSLIKTYSQDPSSVHFLEKARYGLAWTYLKQGHSDLAIQSFWDIIDQSNDRNTRASAMVQIADAYQEINKLPSAIETYDRILKEYSDTIFADYAQYRQGIALLKADRVEAATMSFQSLQSHFPQSKYLNDIKYYLALAYFKKGEWANALNSVSTYLNDQQDRKEFQGEALYLQGLTLFNMQNYDQASEAFKKVAKNFNQHPHLHQPAELYLAKSLSALNRAPEATEKFKMIIKTYPDTEVAEEALLWLGDHELSTGRFAEATGYFLEFMERFPSSNKRDFALFALGQSFEGGGRLDDAVKTYQQIPQTPQSEISAKARLAIADIFSRTMDPQTAISAYQKIAETIPEFRREALLRVASIQKNSQKYSDAVATYENILENAPKLNTSDAAAIYFEIGDAYELMNETERSVDSYLRIPYLFPDATPWVIRSYLRSARIFEEARKWQDAATAYQKVIEMNVEEGKYAKERLDWITANTAANPAAKE